MKNYEEPKISKRLLSPTERISEVLFGLIMALTFTCTISIIDTDRTEVKDMLIGAICCNIAWGLVDAIMYLIISMTEKGHGLTIFNFVRNTEDKEKAHLFISDSLPQIIASGMNSEELELLRKRILLLPEPPAVIRLKFLDFKIAIGIFLIVFASTLPIALPFVFVQDLKTALRLSNIIAIFMMFICGWILGKYAGRNRFLVGIIMSLIGIALVLLTISLGG